MEVTEEGGRTASSQSNLAPALAPREEGDSPAGLLLQDPKNPSQYPLVANEEEIELSNGEEKHSA